MRSRSRLRISHQRMVFSANASLSVSRKFAEIGSRLMQFTMPSLPVQTRALWSTHQSIPMPEALMHAAYSAGSWGSCSGRRTGKPS